jgi:hypothetical protein
MRKTLTFLVLLPIGRTQAALKEFLRSVNGGTARGRVMIWPIAALILAISLAPKSATATYNANITGTVTWVSTYTSGAMLLILSDQPSSNGTCNPAFFELDPPTVAGADVVNDAAFNRMYARALTSYTTGNSVNIGYDNSGTCGVSGYIRIYRIG